MESHKNAPSIARDPVQENLREFPEFIITIVRSNQALVSGTQETVSFTKNKLHLLSMQLLSKLEGVLRAE